MKRLLFFSITIISIVLMQSCAPLQYLTSEEKSKVVDVDGKTKDELYIRANTWMVETFNNAESVIQFSDKENGIVTGKYLMANIITSTTTSNNVYAIIKIQVKEGAAKITVTPQPYQNNPNPFAGGVGYPLEKLNADIDALFDDFSKSIVETEEF